MLIITSLLIAYLAFRYSDKLEMNLAYMYVVKIYHNDIIITIIEIMQGTHVITLSYIRYYLIVYIITIALL